MPIDPKLKAKIDALPDEVLKADILHVLDSPGDRSATDEEIVDILVENHMEAMTRRALREVRRSEWREDVIALQRAQFVARACEATQQRQPHAPAPRNTPAHTQAPSATSSASPVAASAQQAPVPRVATPEPRILPTPSGMSFCGAKKRRGEAEQISPGSLQTVGQLDQSEGVESGPSYRMLLANEQDLMRALGVEDAQDRAPSRDKPGPQQQAEARPAVPSVAAAKASALLQEAPGAAPAAHMPAPGHTGAAPVVVPNPQGVALEQRAHVPAPSPPVTAPSAAALVAEAYASLAASQAELAELRLKMARMYLEEQRRQDERAWRKESAERDKRAAVQAGPLLREFSDPSHPQHALYSVLKAHLPQGLSEERLAQGTAACYRARITAKDLSDIYLGDASIVLVSNSVHAVRAHIDVSRPAPSIQQSLQGVQQYDLQQAQRMGEIQALNTAQANPYQGPTLH